MGVRDVTVDYLVVGAGAMGMAFTDSLVAHSDATVLLVDRRHAPGGHWNDAYEFCRLHQPSGFYGVDSVPLGTDTVDERGLNEGGYERATAPELRAYYQRVLDGHLLPTGQVEFLSRHEHLGQGRLVSMVTGDEVQVRVREKVVRPWLTFDIPLLTPPPFSVADGVRCVPVNALTRLDEPASGHVIVGGGKTSMDAVLWLLEQGVDPDTITWIRPREALLTNREFFQPGELAWSFVVSGSRYAQAGARASSVDEFVDHLLEHRMLLQVDPDVRATMARLPTVNDRELEQLRRVRDVVRLGRVRAIERDRIVLDAGEVPTDPGRVHVHCAVSGSDEPLRPVFSEGEVWLQLLRWQMPCVSAAVTGFLEATRRDDEGNNRLCQPHGLTNHPRDVATMTLHSLRSDFRWSGDAELDAFMNQSRLNPARGWQDHLGRPEVLAAAGRYAEHVADAVDNLGSLLVDVR